MITPQKSTGVDYRPYDEIGSGFGVSTALMWNRIWRRKWLIMFSSTVMFTFLSAIIVLLPVSYTAETEIVVEQRPQGVDLAAVLSRIPTDSQAVLTEAEALRSRELVQRTIGQLGLLSNPEFNSRIIVEDGSLRSEWRHAKAAVTAFIEAQLPARAAKRGRSGS